MAKTTQIKRQTTTPSHKAAPIQYAIVPKDLAGHVFEVTLEITQPDAEGQIVSLPAWIPGSYMVREFARHIVQIKATCEGKKSPLKSLISIPGKLFLVSRH